nr:hypothetical protein [Tanacetum cinerariifolium]
NKEGDAAFDGKEHDAKKPESAVNVSPSSSALSGEQDDKTKKMTKGKSLVESVTGNKDLNPDFKDYSKDISNDFNAAGPIVPTAGVLVTKPHNKTPYELLRGRTPSIGFMRPFGCPVTILNTLDPLGTSPTWLFDIDSLTRTMNYQPVTAGNQSNPSAGFQGEFDAEKAGKEANQQYMLFPVWSTGSSNPQNKEGDAAFDGKEHDVEQPESAVNLSPSSSALSREQDDITKKKDKGKSHVEYFIGNKDLNADFKDYSGDSSNDVSAAGPIVPTAGQNYSNNTNPFSAAGPLNTNTSPTHGKLSLKVASQLSDNSDMLKMEDIDYSDHENVSEEADFNNLETSITVNPITTKRTHKAHLISQIIGDLPSTTQTRSMTRVIKDQDPSWIEAMQEELLQFTMQKVWILVDLPHGKRAIGTKWVYKNKKDERGIVVKNKARLVAQGHTQEEGINYEEVFAPVARIKAIRLFLAYASFMGFMGKPHLRLWYTKDSPFDLVAYSDSDYAGASLDRKSTTEGCQFLGCKLISWQCKKQTIVATSSTEAEYVAAASCCAQVLWIQNQMLDYGYIEYALTVNPTIYVSCIKQFCNTVAVKQSNDVTRLQALVDKKKVVVTEAAIRNALCLEDAEGVDCLPNEEIFTELARMGYEKLSTKLTFYKAFFSSQWKFLIHTILQSMSAKRTSWNEFSSAMASAVICLSTCRKFNFSKHIFESLVINVDSSSKFYMYPRRVGKGCSGVETLLFEGMLVARETEKQGDAEEQGTDDNVAKEPDTAVSEDDEALDGCATIAKRIEHLEHDKVAQDLEIIKLKTRVKKLERANKVKALKLQRLRKVWTSQRVDTLDDTIMEDVSNQGRMIDELDRDKGVVLMSEKEEKKAEEEAVEVVTTAKLITEVIAAVSEIVSAAAVVPTITVAPIKVAVPSTRRRRRVVIRDPEEESSAKTPTETKSKDK